MVKQPILKFIRYRAPKTKGERRLFVGLSFNLNGDYISDPAGWDEVWNLTQNIVKEIEATPEFKYHNKFLLIRSYISKSITVYVTGTSTGNNKALCGFVSVENISSSKQQHNNMTKLKAVPPPAADIKVENILLSDITPSKTNPRKHFDKVYIQELADSMKPPVGLLQPITLVKKESGYEIAFGECRYRAAKLLKWTTIPSIVKEIAAEDLFALQILENLQREDVSPLDEAAAFKTLLQKESIDWLASKIHKTKKYIADRLKLNDLIKEAADRVNKGELPLGHAVIMSKLTYSDQMACLSECFEGSFIGEGAGEKEICEMTIEGLRDYIEEELMLVFSHVSFDLDDETLYLSAGSCTACPKRTCNNNLLFSDITSDDRCTDKACFKEKQNLHMERAKSEAKEKYGKVLTGDKTYNTKSTEIKVQGVVVPVQKIPTKNSIPVVIQKADSYNDKKLVGTTVYIDKNKIEQVKLQKEDEKKNNSSSKTKAESWQEKQVRVYKEDYWPRISVVTKNLAFNGKIVYEYFRNEFDVINDRVFYGFAGINGFIPDVTTPELAIGFHEDSDLDFDEKKIIIDKVIEKYTPLELVTILMLLNRCNEDADDDDIDHESEYGYSWKEMMELIHPMPKEPVKKNNPLQPTRTGMGKGVTSLLNKK